MNSLDDWYALLKDNYTDTVTRAVFRDWLWDHGHEGLALAQDWMLKNEKWPVPSLALTAGELERFWWLGSYEGREYEGRPYYQPAIVPSEMFAMLRGCSVVVSASVYWKHYPSQQSAEEDIARVLARQEKP